MDRVIRAVLRRIKSEDLSPATLASAVGVTESALKRHLSGGYVRSDSLAKYRRWLGGSEPGLQTSLAIGESPTPVEDQLADNRIHEPIAVFSAVRPPKRLRVVDLFCG